MKINEDLQLPSLNKSILNAITDATEIYSYQKYSNYGVIKLRNGIAIQYGAVGTRSYNMNKSYRNAYEYYANPTSGDFVAGFISAPFVLLTPVASSELPRITVQSVTKDKVSWFVSSSFSGTITFDIHYWAIGYWK